MGMYLLGIILGDPPAPKVTRTTPLQTVFFEISKLWALGKSRVSPYQTELTVAMSQKKFSQKWPEKPKTRYDFIAEWKSVAHSH
jgi:hypothetical protein